MSDVSIVRSPEGVTVVFDDDVHDAMATMCQGMVRSVRRISIGNMRPANTRDELCLCIGCDPSTISVCELIFNTTKVTAIAYANLSSGIQRIGNSPQPGNGRIAVVLILHLDVPDSTLVRAAITSTEAITAAVQDLGLSYNSMTASGSADQEIIVVRDRGSDLFLRGAGKHSKLGELIGRTTLQAVKESAAGNGTDIASRRSVSAMLASYGYDIDRLSKMVGRPLSVTERDSDPAYVGTVSAVLHLYNESRWGLVSDIVAFEVGKDAISSGIGEPVEGSDLLETLALTVVKYVFK